jgi:hypothetical protein
MRTISIITLFVSLALLDAVPVLAQTGHDLFQQALVKERADGDLRGAIEIYERIAREFTPDRPLAAKALVQLGQCYEKLGSTEAERAYRRVDWRLCSVRHERLRKSTSRRVESGLD